MKFSRFSNISVATAVALISLAIAAGAAIFSLTMNHYLLLTVIDEVFEESMLDGVRSLSLAASRALVLSHKAALEQRAEGYISVQVYDMDGKCRYAFGSIEKPRFVPVARPSVVYREPGKVHVVLPIIEPAMDSEVVSGTEKIGYLYAVASTSWKDKIVKAAGTTLVVGTTVAIAGSILVLAFVFRKIASYAQKITSKMASILSVNRVTEENKLHLSSRLREIRIAIDTYNTVIDRLIRLDWANRAMIDNLRREAETSVRKRRRMAALIAHEMKTPLAALGTSLHRTVDYILECQRMSLMDKEVAEHLLAETLHLRSKIDALHAHVDNAASVAGGSSPKVCFVRFCVHSWMSGLKLMASDLLPNRRISFFMRTETATFYSDPEKLNEIACIFLDNAGKHTTKEAEIGVHVQCTDRELSFGVSDTGPGIEPDLLVRLLDGFVRIYDRHWQGDGLHMASQLAEALGGRMQVMSEVGRGSFFEVIVPNQKTDLQLSDALPRMNSGASLAIQNNLTSSEHSVL